MEHTTWFKPKRWIYRPTTWLGTVATLLVLAFCVQVFFAVDQNSHSVSNTLFGIFPYVVPSLMILYWVASKTSDE